MNFLPSREKLVSLSAKEANLLRIGLIYTIKHGVYGGNQNDPLPLAPDDQKYEGEMRNLAHKMIDLLEEVLYEFDAEKRENLWKPKK